MTPCSGRPEETAMKSHILTITLNPTVDFCTTVAAIVPGPKLRCTDPQIDPGGGGINVARAVKLLGGQATALVAIGGATGAHLLQLLALEGVPTVAFQGPGETRQSMSVIDQNNRATSTASSCPDRSGRKHDVPRALNSVDQATGEDTLVVLSGSQPPGRGQGLSVDSGRPRGRPAGADDRGYLRSGAEPSGGSAARGAACAPDGRARGRGPGGRPLRTREDTAEFAQSLVKRGVAKTIIVARGADGSVLATADGAWHSVNPPVDVVSKVGAGDSFVGAFTLALAGAEPIEDCLRWGVAAASAAVMSDATRLCDRKTTEELLASARSRGFDASAASARPGLQAQAVAAALNAMRDQTLPSRPEFDLPLHHREPFQPIAR